MFEELDDDLDDANLNAIFSDDLMKFDEKIKFITEIVCLKKKFVSLYEQMLRLKAAADEGRYLKDPFTRLCVKAFLQSEKNFGTAISELKDAIVDIHDRLYECGGDSEVVRSIQAEFDALRPKIEELDAHFTTTREQIEKEKEQMVQSN